MNEQQSEMLGLTFLGLLVAAMGAYMVLVWAPYNDRVLFATHDCFVERGCEDNLDYGSSEFNQCWASCEDEVVAQIDRERE